MTQPRQIRYVSLSEVQPALRNPRLHDSIAGVKASIARFGFVEGAVHDGRTGRIIAGHGRLEALTAMEAGGAQPPEGILVVDGRWQMPLQVGWSSRSDAEAEALLVSLNRLTETGGWDDRELAALLEDLRAADDPDLLGLSGYDEKDLDKLLTDLANAQPDQDHGDKDLDDVPDLQATPLSVAGDVWLLGEHRLAVGDSTDPDVFRNLLGAEQADMVWTDPPYGVAYGTAQKRSINHRTDGLTVPNDDEVAIDAGGLRELLTEVLGLAFEASRPGACWYVTCPTGTQLLEFAMVTSSLGVWRHMIVWVKHRFVFGQTDYHSRHEGMLYGWKSGAPHHAVADKTQDNVWEIDMPHRSVDHPTIKPTELVVRAIKNSSDVGDIVLDPFAGSGTTLIACETTRRKARVIELDEKYADVILRRYFLLTGVSPVRERDGVSWVELDKS